MLFIKSDHDFSQVDSITYDKEDQMQSYIYENPKLLPVEELTGNKKLLVLIRELSTDYGRLDGLGIDEAGNLYIIETKLLRNPDRRSIIAQLLDYGVALWTKYKDPQELINYLSDKDINIKQLILDTFETSEDLADIIIDKFKANLKSWVYQFVAVTDAIEKRILDQVHFINQNSNFSFFLVDLRFYTHDGVEFIIPKGYGGEIIKNTSWWSWASTRAWEIADFLDIVESNLWFSSREFYQELSNLFESKWYKVEIRIWKKPTMLVFNNFKDDYLFSVYSDTGEIRVNKKSKLWWFDRPDFFKKVFGFEIDPNAKQNQFKLHYHQYKDRSQEILTNVSQLDYNKAI
jgi:hypothetical protein